MSEYENYVSAFTGQPGCKKPVPTSVVAPISAIYMKIGRQNYSLQISHNEDETLNPKLVCDALRRFANDIEADNQVSV